MLLSRVGIAAGRGIASGSGSRAGAADEAGGGAHGARGEGEADGGTEDSLRSHAPTLGTPGAASALSGPAITFGSRLPAAGSPAAY